MSTTKFFDVMVVKEFETKQDGQTVKKKIWSKVGRAWPTRTFESLNLEFLMFPNQIYVVQLSSRKENQENTNPQQGV